jgi:uncharacterized protein YhfF
LDDSPTVMWEAFRASGLPAASREASSYTSWHFGFGGEVADELARLVLSGRKRATTASLWAHETEGEPLPRVGDFSVVADAAGVAQCVIRTTIVEIVAFSAVDASYAEAEGEGDLSLSYWRDVHWAVFSQELRDLGRAPEPDMPVVCERFEVVYPVAVETLT